MYFQGALARNKNMMYLTKLWLVIFFLQLAKNVASNNNTAPASSWTEVVHAMEDKINRLEERLRRNQDDTDTENSRLLQIMTNLLMQNEESRRKEEEYEQKIEELAKNNQEMQGTVGSMRDIQMEVRECRNMMANLQRFRSGMEDTPGRQHEERDGRTSADGVSIAPLHGFSIVNQLLRMMVRQSCYDWQSLGFTVSGYYMIDPDGVGAGEPSFSVYCDMVTGFTFVHHDSEGTTEVTPCDGPGCYERVIRYNATERQIRALFKISSSCQQHVKLDCQSTPLKKPGRTLSWWEDVTGRTHEYWAGEGNDGIHTCACGLSKGCVDPRFRCNCDGRVGNMWLSDSGYISNMSSLPVYKLNFGSVTDGPPLKMKYTLGPLRCHGWRKLLYPESCEDLQAAGIAQNGYYILGEPEHLQVMFCDMKASVNGDAATQHIQALDLTTITETVTELENATRWMADRVQALDQKIVFQANRYTSQRNSKIVLTYDTVVLNIGDALNGTTGFFTSPINGTYQFSFFGYKYENKDTTVDLWKNNEIIAFSKSYSSVSWASFGTMVITELKVGDEVAVYLKSGGTFGRRPDRPFSFSGMLLHVTE